MSPAKRNTARTNDAQESVRTTTDREVELATQTDQSSSSEGDSDLYARIRDKAYEIYQSRNGGDGNELDDWLEAERHVQSAGKSETAEASHAPTEGRGPSLLDALSNDERRDVSR